jgi:hypothetical protein
MTDKHVLIRDTDAWDSIELILVSAVASILCIRGYLAVAGYPRLGGEILHIAHMLWGGLFMLAAAVLLLVYWNPSMRRFSALLAGIGFGTFIDELGKFITHDADYFYKPAVAMIYVMLVLLFLVARSLLGSRPLSAEERTINAELRGSMPEGRASLGTRINGYFTLRERLNGAYRRLVLSRWFTRALVAGFIAVGLAGLIIIVIYVVMRSRGSVGVSTALMIASAGSFVCIWIGIARLPAGRLRAYIWFKRSVLVNIYFTQVFMFYRSQFAALWGLLANVLIYTALLYTISREEM